MSFNLAYCIRQLYSAYHYLQTGDPPCQWFRHLWDVLYQTNYPDNNWLSDNNFFPFQLIVWACGEITLITWHYHRGWHHCRYRQNPKEQSLAIFDHLSPEELAEHRNLWPDYTGTRLHANSAVPTRPTARHEATQRWDHGEARDSSMLLNSTVTPAQPITHSQSRAYGSTGTQPGKSFYGATWEDHDAGQLLRVCR